MKVFLTSDVGASDKINGERCATKLNNTNSFVDIIKPLIKKNDLLLFFASSPNTYEISNKFAEFTFQSFNMSGISFKRIIMVDGGNASDAKKLINEADLIFLAGGETKTQMNFFEDIKLRELLKSYKGVVIGQSAGALNLAETVYCSPEADDELNNERYWKGLGLTKISVEPHFDKNSNVGGGLINNVLLPDSKKRPFIAITDGSYIFDDGKNQTIYGEAYLFKGGEYKQLCENGKNYSL